MMSSAQVLDTLSGLVRINSVNPVYPQGRPEAEIQEYVLAFFRRHGIPAVQQSVAPDRYNVIACLPGRRTGPRIVFEAHSDTAGVEGMTIAPFEAALRNGRLYGRGACDTKAGLAAMMHALVDLRHSGCRPPCEVWVVAAVDEEHSYRGVLKLCENLEASAAVVAEPTDMRLAVASKGCIRWRITVRGKSAHSSKPDLGVNAIMKMAHVLVALESEPALLGSSTHPLVGSPTLNVGLIEGGTQINVVPEFCSIAIDRRVVPGEVPDQVLGACEQFLERLRASCSDLDVAMEPPMVKDWPLDTPPDAAIVQCAAKVLEQERLDPRPQGVPFGSDASKFARARIPAVVLGPGSIDQAHTVDEYVELDQVEQAFVVYRKLMCAFE